jgi:hypothetical protein
MLANNHELRVHDSYTRAIDSEKREGADPSRLGRVWFSDTFLLYSVDGTLQSYEVLDRSARHFFERLILNEIPVRGAIAYGSAYIDLEEAVVYGLPIVEAFRYGEAQDWLGLLVCPSALAELRQHDLPSPLNYVTASIPWSEHKTPSGAPAELPAFVIGRDSPRNGKSPYVSSLEAMRGAASHLDHRSKYDLTLNFIREHDTLVVPTPSPFPLRSPSP